MKRKNTGAVRQSRTPRKRLVSKSRAVRERFAAELQGAQMMQLDPLFCFPLIQDRAIYDGGVRKMMRVLTGQGEDGTGITSGNICAGSGTPLAVIVTEQYRPFLRKYLAEKGFNEDELQTNMDQTWYGIVDGIFRLFAIRRLEEEIPDTWGCFQEWSVMVLRSTPSIDRLRQMKRSFEENRRSANLIDVTLYDEYRRMLDVYKSLKVSLGREPISYEVATAYDGNEHVATDVISQRVRTAVRLGESVVETLGRLMCEECPSLASERLTEKHPGRDFRKISLYVDTRV